MQSTHRTSLESASASRASTEIEDSSSIKENDPSISSTTSYSSSFVPRTKAQFSYIVTRPTSFLKDGPSTKKVMASKSVRYQFNQTKFLEVSSTDTSWPPVLFIFRSNLVLSQFLMWTWQNFLSTRFSTRNCIIRVRTWLPIAFRIEKRGAYGKQKNKCNKMFRKRENKSDPT
jgi:hypothetical protein